MVSSITTIVGWMMGLILVYLLISGQHTSDVLGSGSTASVGIIKALQGR